MVEVNKKANSCSPQYNMELLFNITKIKHTSINKLFFFLHSMTCDLFSQRKFSVHFPWSVSYSFPVSSAAYLRAFQYSQGFFIVCWHRHNIGWWTVVKLCLHAVTKYFLEGRYKCKTYMEVKVLTGQSQRLNCSTSYLWQKWNLPNSVKALFTEHSLSICSVSDFFGFWRRCCSGWTPYWSISRSGNCYPEDSYLAWTWAIGRNRRCNRHQTVFWR